jgi:hypothetical protein
MGSTLALGWLLQYWSINHPEDTTMLKAAPIRPYIPASDVSRARRFYEQQIGLEPKEEYAFSLGGTPRTPLTSSTNPPTHL